MPDSTQDGADGPAVRGHADRHALVVREDVVQQLRQPRRVRRAALAEVREPERVFLCEARLDGVCRVVFLNVGPRRPLVARVDPHAFPQQLLHHGLVRPVGAEVQARPGHVGRFQRAVQRRDVEGLRRWHLLRAHLRRPEVVHGLGLGDAHARQVCVEPRRAAVRRAGQGTPVAVPRLLAVVGLGDVVDALAVAGEEEQAVRGRGRRGIVQCGEVVCETLPCRGRGGGRQGRVGVVGAGNQAKVVLHLQGRSVGRQMDVMGRGLGGLYEVEACGIGGSVVLQEIAFDGAVSEVKRRRGRSVPAFRR